MFLKVFFIISFQLYIESFKFSKSFLDKLDVNLTILHLTINIMHYYHLMKSLRF